jgi:glycosyltransferase involved in cell wall biosynthesis
VALDQDMKAELESMAGHEARVLPPWPPELPAEAAVAPSDWHPSGERIWLYSGNLGRAHDFETLLETQALLEQHPTPWRLIFQGGGPAWPQAQQLAEQLGLSRCEWLPYAEETQLLARLQQADVLIATQKPETRGLLWPSKLALMQLLERPILFVGPRDSALAQSLRSTADDKSPHGVIAPGDAAAASAYLLALPERRPALPHQQIHERVHDLRQKGQQQWLAWLNEWHDSHQAAKAQR